MPAQQISFSLSKPPDFFARHVRHLGVDNNVSRAAVHKILSVSTGIINLALFHGTSTPALIPYLGHIRPRRLAVNMIGLFAGVPDFTHCMFSNITHLDVSDTFGSDLGPWSMCQPLSLRPAGMQASNSFGRAMATHIPGRVCGRAQRLPGSGSTIRHDDML